MTATGVYTPLDYESRLKQFLFESSEEGRAVRVGEKETSEQAEIVARYADLFTRDQLEALHEAESGAQGDDREQLYRLRKVCEGGIVSAELVEREDELENRQLAARLTFQGEEMPLRTAQAKLAVVDGYADREELGDVYAELNASFNDDRLDLARAGEELSADLSGEPDPVARNEEEKGISLRTLASALAETAAASDRGVPAHARDLVRARPRPGPRRRSRARTTWRTCAGSRRSSPRTRRSARPRSAWRR